MDTFQRIDLETWPRRELFEHYRYRTPCSYAVTVELDVTEMTAALRASHRKTYLAQIWAIASIVNRHNEFRLMLTDQGAPAVWDVLHPAFTVFNPERETFASVWAPFYPDFGRFHDEASELLVRHRSAATFTPQGEMPANTFDVSSLPWTRFTSFTIQIAAGNHMLPIFTLGRCTPDHGRVVLPVAMQIHHAAADGFHTSRLLKELQELVAEPSWIG